MGPSMLPFKTGSGNRLRHWPAGQQFAWLCSCSPALSCLVPSHSFPNREGTIQSTVCARDHPQQTLGTAATGRPEKTQSQLPWGSHVWISKKILSYFVLGISWLLASLQQKIVLDTVVFWHIQSLKVSGLCCRWWVFFCISSQLQVSLSLKKVLLVC